jgi:hypothetical protein
MAQGWGLKVVGSQLRGIPTRRRRRHSWRRSGPEGRRSCHSAAGCLMWTSCTGPLRGKLADATRCPLYSSRPAAAGRPPCDHLDPSPTGTTAHLWHQHVLARSVCAAMRRSAEAFRRNRHYPVVASDYRLAAGSSPAGDGSPQHTSNAVPDGLAHAFALYAQ